LVEVMTQKMTVQLETLLAAATAPVAVVTAPAAVATAEVATATAVVVTAMEVGRLAEAQPALAEP
jgi:hypothetical protein